MYLHYQKQNNHNGCFEFRHSDVFSFNIINIQPQYPFSPCPRKVLTYSITYNFIA